MYEFVRFSCPQFVCDFFSASFVLCVVLFWRFLLSSGSSVVCELCTVCGVCVAEK